MQVAVIAFARSVCGLKDANSGEFDAETKNKVIDFMPGQSDDINKGGTMRLGAYECRVQRGTLLERCYNSASVSERHRHRYEFNNDYRAAMNAHGMTFGGLSPDGNIVETVELPANRFFMGVQFHPEFKSRPNRAHPLFKAFIKAALES